MDSTKNPPSGEDTDRETQTASDSPSAEHPRPSTWTVVVRARGSGDDASRAFKELYERYRQSVIVKIRASRYRWNRTEEDLADDFFSGVFQRGDLDRLDRERGSFRAWLNVAVTYFLRKEWHRFMREMAVRELPLELQSEVPTPERLFMRQFAEDTLRHALERARVLQRADVRDPASFDAWVGVGVLPGRHYKPASVPELAAAFGITKNHVSVKIHKLRHQFRRYLHAAIAETLDVDPSTEAGRQAVEAELRELWYALLDPAAPSGTPEDA